MESPRLDCVWGEIENLLKLSPELKEEWLGKVKKTYGESSRAANNLEYLEFKLTELGKVEGKVKDKIILGAAIIFQAMHYDVQSGDNADRCIDLFKTFLTAANHEKDSEFSLGVYQLIHLSVNNSTEEHLTPGGRGDTDEHYFVDINFAIFGSQWDQYKSYCDKTRAEVKTLPDEAYKVLRLKVLQSFLQIPNIFVTEEFRQSYEEQSRENIRREIQEIQETIFP